MLSLLRRLAKNIPTLILAFALSIAVWISAVTASDPNVENTYSHPVIITYLGQDPTLLLIGDPVRQLTIALRAPQSIWDRLNADSSLIKAQVDLSGLGAGDHHVPVQVNVGLHPVEIISRLPDSVTVKLETLKTQIFNIQLVVKG